MISFSQDLVELASLPSILKGSSGLELSKNGNLWTINDHGKPVLYQIDKDSSEVIKTVYLNNKIKDWEDLTTDQEGNFFVGDFGNNKNSRKDLKIYKIPNPDSINSKIITAQIIRFSLSDQTSYPPLDGEFDFDLEAMIHFDSSIYLFSKSRGQPFKGKIKMYKLSDKPGEHIAILKDVFYTGGSSYYDNWITGATLIKEKNTLILLSHDKLFFFTCFEKDNFFKGVYKSFNLNHFSQKEAIAYDSLTKNIYITDERTQGFIGGKLYQLKIPNYLLRCN
jgi:hypothetical protein